MFIETFEEFRERMNCECRPVRGGVVFRNGAKSDGREWHSEPPKNAKDLLVAQLEFLTAKLKHTSELHGNCQSYIFEQARFHELDAGPPPSDVAFKDLQRFQEEVLALRSEIKEKKKKLRKLTGPTNWQKLEARRTKQEQVAEEARQRAAGFQI